MRQLTLLEPERPTLAGLLDALSYSWAHRACAPAHLQVAAEATRARFAAWHGQPLGRGESTRVEAYFAGVIRRQLLRGNDPQTQDARRRLVAATVEADLRAAGWLAEPAAAEARRVAGISGARGAA